MQLDGEPVGGVPGLVALGDRLISRGDRGLTLSDCHVAPGGEMAGGSDGLVALSGEPAGGSDALVALIDRLISHGDRSLALGERGFALTHGAVALGDRRLPLGQRRVQRAGDLVDLLDRRFLSVRGLRALQFRVQAINPLTLPGQLLAGAVELPAQDRGGGSPGARAVRAAARAPVSDGATGTTMSGATVSSSSVISVV
jgi:hypothetical protein